MKLTVPIQLIVDNEQSEYLIRTLEESNGASNAISEIAWERKVFGQFKLHKESYYSIKSAFDLSAQAVIRCISKVSDAYKKDKKTKRLFRDRGSIAYDSRLLSYKSNNTVSIWTVGGRIKVPFVCHNMRYLQCAKGEADLVYRKGKFFLYQTVEIQEAAMQEVEDFIGGDTGQTDIIYLSDGKHYGSDDIKDVRAHYSKVRASVQSKGTKGAKKLLKRLSGKESRFVSITNHTISKQIVAKGKQQNKGISLEDLTGIRETAKPKSKAQKTELNRWSFYQLHQYIVYKALLAGVPVVFVPPAYTSQTCHKCMHIGERNGKRFKCNHCGNKCDADYNASNVIRIVGVVVNQPEKSAMLCCQVHRA